MAPKPTPPPISLEASGFNRVNADITKRLIISSQGREKEGKTRFALTAPGPIAILNLDIGLEGVVEQFVGDKEIWQKRLSAPILPPKTEPAVMIQQYLPLWEDFTTTYHNALATARTVIVDSMTEAWEMLRLARFGKLTQVMPTHYGPVNAEFNGLINAAYFSKANVIYIHREKDEYVNNARTGKLEFAGQKDIPFKVQVNLRHYRDKQDGTFKVDVLNCRQNSALMGETLEEPLNVFSYLASLVYPDTDMADWM